MLGLCDLLVGPIGLIVGVSCLLCSSALPGVWSFLRVTHASHDIHVSAWQRHASDSGVGWLNKVDNNYRQFFGDIATCPARVGSFTSGSELARHKCHHSGALAT